MLGMGLWCVAVLYIPSYLYMRRKDGMRSWLLCEFHITFTRIISSQYSNLFPVTYKSSQKIFVDVVVPINAFGFIRFVRNRKPCYISKFHKVANTKARRRQNLQSKVNVHPISPKVMVSLWSKNGFFKIKGNETQVHDTLFPKLVRNKGEEVRGAIFISIILIMHLL